MRSTLVGIPISVNVHHMQTMSVVACNLSLCKFLRRSVYVRVSERARTWMCVSALCLRARVSERKRERACGDSCAYKINLWLPDE